MSDAKLRAERWSWTCALENFAGVYGTGVLIGPDLVLTNFHVVQALQKLQRDDRNLVAAAGIHFDYFGPGAGQTVRLATDWLLAFSPFAKRDLNIQEQPEQDKLDYAVIRLERRIGEEPLPEGNAAGWPDGTKPAKRGWLFLPAPETRPASGVNISIYHHPFGYLDNRDQSIPGVESNGRIVSIDIAWLRVTHDARTQHGSSGAICYGDNLEPVALHHAGDPGSALGQQYPNQKPLPPGQRAIPLGAITAQLSRLPDQSIYQSMLPPKEASSTVEVGKTNEVITQEVLKSRHKRAMALLDRDDPEWNIIDSIQTAKSLVHAIACRSVDGPGFFMTRLREASLAFEKLPRPEMEDRLSRFLNKGATENGWRDGSATLDMTLAPADAAAKIVRRIDYEITPEQGTVFAIEQTFDRFDFERQRLIVTEVGRLCTKLVNDGRTNFQIFFIYQDNGSAPQRWARERASIPTLWANPPPPGSNLGQCLNFDDIDCGQMKRWILAIDRAYRIDRQKLSDRVDDILGDRKMPFAALEPKLWTATKDFYRNTK